MYRSERKRHEGGPVLRNGAAARIRRRVALVVVLACVVGAAGAAAQQGTTSTPEELWRDYPLEQTATTTAPSPPATNATTAVSSEDGGSALWWIVAAVAGATLALVAVAARRQASRSRVTEERIAPSPAPPPSPRPPARRPANPDAPVCQIRWSRQGGFFFAVTVGPDGSERGIARSPRFDWDGPSPPEPAQEPEAALKVLSKELRDKGWRPLRAKGFDFDQRRWYARRFKWPTEGSAT